MGLIFNGPQTPGSQATTNATPTNSMSTYVRNIHSNTEIQSARSARTAGGNRDRRITESTTVGASADGNHPLVQFSPFCIASQ